MKLLVYLLLLTSGITTFGASVFTVQDKQILLNGEPFRIKGICYSPNQIGQSGTLTPFGDFFTGLFLATTGPDNENMRRMGANVQRGYGWTVGSNHTAYLDRSYNDGVDPIYVFINRWIDPSTDWDNPAAVNAIVSDWVAIAEETKDHPAVIGYLFGNEANVQSGNGTKASFWRAMETIAAAVKEEAPDKLVSFPITDALSSVQIVDELVPTIDFWSIQVYRSTTFGSFFDEYKLASDKPVVLTEYGYDAFDNIAQSEYPDNAAFTADVVEGMIKEIEANSDVCAGGMIFSYRDEWWKAQGGASAHDNGGITALGMPDGLLNEEWWGIFAAEDNGFLPDRLNPRALYYRLISLWNPIPEFDAKVILDESGLVIEYDRDDDDRDFRYEIQISNDLNNWTAIADNSNSGAMEAVDGETTLTITEILNEGILKVRVEDPGFLDRGNGTFVRAGVGRRE